MATGICLTEHDLLPASSRHGDDHRSEGRRMKSGDPRSGADRAILVHPLMTVAEVARVLGVGQRTVWRMASRSQAGSGQFPKPVRIGDKAVRWRWQDLEKYLQQLAEKPLDVRARQR